MKILPILISAYFLAGCISTPMALGGKTKYSMQFNDTVSEIKDDTGSVVAPGQDTNFSVNISAAAGVDIKDLASMKYFVTPEGTVDILVASDTSADTTAQAQALLQAHETTMETVKGLAPVIADVVTKALIPVPGASVGVGVAIPRSRRTVDMDRLLAGLHSVGVNITLEQAKALAELFDVDTVQ